MNTPNSEVSPGILAFAAFFLLAIALWLLMRNMFTRLRRMNLAERVEQERRAEEERARQEMAERAREIDLADPDRSAGLGDGPEEGQGRRDEV
ncbi:hypothetical protein [Janibacter limosus]|uniref:hypothetical protein n=1 Tax=Janibacter limosus TaxID=53458 RepID=UPI00082A3F9F|nr:hypothetical protein [Janibacter limosus]